MVRGCTIFAIFLIMFCFAKVFWVVLLRSMGSKRQANFAAGVSEKDQFKKPTSLAHPRGPNCTHQMLRKTCRQKVVIQVVLTAWMLVFIMIKTPCLYRLTHATAKQGYAATD